MTALFRAGAGRAAISTASLTWPLDGFTGEHDSLHVRVLVLESDRRLVLAVLDQTSLMADVLERVRSIIAHVTGAEVNNVIVSVSHTFSAPHLRVPKNHDADRLTAQAMLDTVLDATRQAASDAVGSLRPAAVGSASGRCSIAVNRDVETSAGWTLGADESGFTDPTLLVTGIFEPNGSPIAFLTGLGVQPSVMHGSVSKNSDRWVTADVAGAAMAGVEWRFPGAVSFFLIGAAGDQSPSLVAVRASTDGIDDSSDAGDAAFIVVELLGERLAEAVRSTAATITPTRTTGMIDLVEACIRLPGQHARRREDIAPTRSPHYEASPDADAPFWILRIDQTVVVGVQVELSAVTGAALRAASPFTHTFVATMVNGAAKYLPQASAFDHGTYEAQSSRYARGGAELLAHAIQGCLVELHGTEQTDPMPYRATQTWHSRSPQGSAAPS